MMTSQRTCSYFFVCVLLSFFITASAQTKEESAGWLYLSGEQALAKKWSVSADVQLRSADQFTYVSAVLLRPGLVYKFTKKQSATLGYTYFGTWEREDGKTAFTPEHRIWEQYQVKGKIGRAELTNRFRLEQRFIQNEKDLFAQRFRYYIRSQSPFAKQSEFEKGAYWVLQNELFLNVQHAENINHKLYDQNRLYGALGLRLSKQWDVEAGYIYRYQIEDENKLSSHILQLAVYADL